MSSAESFAVIAIDPMSATNHLSQPMLRYLSERLYVLLLVADDTTWIVAL